MKKFSFWKMITAISVISLCAIGNMFAQAPSQCSDVMLQAFYWDAQSECNWNSLNNQSTEIAANFDLVWLAPSAKSSGVGYHPEQLSNQNSNWGSSSELKTLISSLHNKSRKVIADIIINHRGNSSNWTDFYGDNFGSYGSFQFGAGNICCDDECLSNGYTAYGAKDAGYETNCNASGGYCAARDLDHSNTYVQNATKAYLKWMKNEMGYDGWRYDLVKGYLGCYTKMYNEAGAGYMSVGEYWDGDYNKVVNWINATDKTSTAFDFPGKYSAFNNGLAANNFSSMVSGGAPCGLAGSAYKRYAVTFVDNHDTYRDGSKYTGDIPQANAFILSAPGIPCVFWPHWTAYKAAIKSMIKFRKACGIHSESASTAVAGSGYYQCTTIGTKSTLICRIGKLSTPTGYKIACSGTNWAFYVPTDFNIEEQQEQQELTGASIYLRGDQTSWAATSQYLFTETSAGVFELAGNFTITGAFKIADNLWGTSNFGGCGSVTTVSLGDNTVCAGSSSANLTNSSLSFKKMTLRLTDINDFSQGGTLTISNSSDIAEKKDNSFDLYLSNTNNILNIGTDNDIVSVNIYNISGKKIKTSSETQINISALDKGTYIVEVIDNEGNIDTRKFIKL